MRTVSVSATSRVIPVTTVNLSPTINTVLGGGGDGVWFNITAVGAALKYVKQAYSSAKVALASYTLEAGLLNGVPSSETNGIGVAAWIQPLQATKVPGIGQFQKEAGNAAGPAFKNDDNTLLTWLGTHFIANVADTISGRITKQSMLSALKSAKDVNMYGVMPPWSASARGTNGAPACSPYHAFVPKTLENGQQIAAHPGVFLDPLTGKPVYVDPGFKP